MGEEQDRINRLIELGDAAQKMMDTPEFKMVIEDEYINNFALTQVLNAAGYNDEQKRGFMQQTVARSTLALFLDGLVTEADEAKDYRTQEQKTNKKGKK